MWDPSHSLNSADMADFFLKSQKTAPEKAKLMRLSPSHLSLSLCSLFSFFFTKKPKYKTQSELSLSLSLYTSKTQSDTVLIRSMFVGYGGIILIISFSIELFCFSWFQRPQFVERHICCHRNHGYPRHLWRLAGQKLGSYLSQSNYFTAFNLFSFFIEMNSDFVWK